MPRSPKIGQFIRDARPGDVVGFSSCSPTGSVIRAFTCGCFTGLTHVGIVTYWRGCRHYVLLESTSQAIRPCLVAREMVSGVQVQELRHRVLEYPGHVYHYPLAEPLAWGAALMLYQWGETQLGHPYDWDGAARARHTLLARICRRVHGEDRHDAFCSELVAGAHRTLGLLPHQTNAEDFSPRSLVRMERRLGVLEKRRIVK